MEGGGAFSVRLIDCVGYLVPGAVGQLEDDLPRMVHTPWFPEEIPMAEAAEIGTRKVIAEHSTIGIVVTTDGTVTDLPREAYLEAEARVISELKELGKPFLILLNSARPDSDGAQALRAQLAAFSGGRLAELAGELDDLTEIGAHIGAAICDEPPFSVREGGFIRDGYHEEVDRLRHIMNGGKGVLAEIEAKEKERTGIRTLKIGYNKVFGYYIEVSNSFKDQVPDTYIRKQTLVNGERYITQELKDLEHEILTASDRVVALEYELFTALRQEISAQSARIQRTAAAVAEVDALVSFAAVAVRNHYCRPTVDESGAIEIHDGRHPVVEQMLKDSLFVPNDTFMGEKEDRVAIITGPNMAGKSTYMRQVALIVLMAQMGSFVPARSARIGVVDRVFTRIGPTMCCRQ